MRRATNHGSEPRVRRWARRLRATFAITLITVTGAATAAQAASFSGGFGAAPVGAGASGYFSVTLGPGTGATRTVLISNLRATRQTLDLYAVRGVTAPSSGDVYVGKPGTCAAVGCWIARLPARLTLAAHRARSVAFAVHVPAGTTPGQYLGGVAVQPARSPAPTAGQGARSVIVHEVVIGVAVTVGSHYASRLWIPRVTGAAIGDVGGIAVAEANGGAQFEHPTGTATVVANGASNSFPLLSRTMLPGGRATLRVLTPHIAPGAYPARVALTYDGGARTTYWSGTVQVPAVRTGAAGPNGRALAVSQRSSSPPVLLLLGTGVGGAVLAALTVSLHRRRRGHRAAAEHV